MRKRRAKYKSEYPRLLYTYFTCYKEAIGAPSFSKFARSIGVRMEDLDSFRKNREFDAAYRECNEIRRDYLIDNALCKKFDASFTKFILTDESLDSEKSSDDSEVKITLEVPEDMT